MSANSNSRNRKYFAFVTVPQHLTTELIKLNGMQFDFKYIIVENAKNKPTAFSGVSIPIPRDQNNRFSNARKKCLILSNIYQTF